MKMIDYHELLREAKDPTTHPDRLDFLAWNGPRIVNVAAWMNPNIEHNKLMNGLNHGKPEAWSNPAADLFMLENPTFKHEHIYTITEGLRDGAWKPYPKARRRVRSTLYRHWAETRPEHLAYWLAKTIDMGAFGSLPHRRLVGVFNNIANATALICGEIYNGKRVQNAEFFEIVDRYASGKEYQVLEPSSQIVGQAAVYINDMLAKPGVAARNDSNIISCTVTTINWELGGKYRAGNDMFDINKYCPPDVGTWLRQQLPFAEVAGWLGLPSDDEAQASRLHEGIH